jgi:hypothetical protein
MPSQEQEFMWEFFHVGSDRRTNKQLSVPLQPQGAGTGIALSCPSHLPAQIGEVETGVGRGSRMMAWTQPFCLLLPQLRTQARLKVGRGPGSATNCMCENVISEPIKKN